MVGAVIVRVLLRRAAGPWNKAIHHVTDNTQSSAEDWILCDIRNCERNALFVTVIDLRYLHLSSYSYIVISCEIFNNQKLHFVLRDSFWVNVLLFIKLCTHASSKVIIKVRALTWPDKSTQYVKDPHIKGAKTNCGDTNNHQKIAFVGQFTIHHSEPRRVSLVCPAATSIWCFRSVSWTKTLHFLCNNHLRSNIKLHPRPRPPHHSLPFFPLTVWEVFALVCPAPSPCLLTGLSSERRSIL